MIHLVDNPERIYQEIARVLKPDGSFIHFTSYGFPKTEEQLALSNRCYKAFCDIRDKYYQNLQELNYEPQEFNTNYLEIEKKYFQKVEEVRVLEYQEEFTEYMKFRIHRLEHKAHSFLQHIPDEIHQEAWRKVNQYA